MEIQPPSRFRAGISPELDAIVLKALDRDPEKRWQSAGSIREALSEEARRQGVVISGPQIRDWVEWAFHQTARHDSSVDRMLRGMSPSVSIEIADVEPASSAEIAEAEFDANVTNPLPKVEREDIADASSPRPAHSGTWRPGRSLAARSLLADSAVLTPRPSVLRRAISAEEDESPTVDRQKRVSTSPFVYPAASPLAPAMSPRRIARAASEVAFLPATTMDSLLATRPETPAAAMHARANTPPFVAKPGVHVPNVATPVANFVLPTTDAPIERPVSIVAVPSIARIALPLAPPPEPAPAAAPTAKAPARKRAARKARALPSRAPNWRAPTRWARAQPRRSGARIMILLALVAIAALLVDQGLIDIERWREILGV
jgi:serine/threonine-protein kinase